VAPYFGGAKTEFCRTRKLGWARYYSDFDLASPELSTSLVLKAPAANGEKGVLYTAFEYNLMRLLAHSDAKRLLSEYIVIGASSWSPTDYAVMANFAGLSDDPLFLGISNVSDIEAYRIAAPAVRPLPLMASDWIDPRSYSPKPHSAREIDFLMVANFSRFKRHWLLFRALRRMSPKVRVAILGIATPERSADTLHAEARAFGVKQDLEIRTNLSIEEVAEYQSNSRVSLLLSRREGSCVATAESLFADSPVGMMHDAHIGSKAYINSATGMLLAYGDLSRQLGAFLERSGEFRSREWAEANITAHRSAGRLNQILKEHAAATGRPWTQDLAPMCWRYVPRYLHTEDESRLRPAVDDMAERLGVRLKAFTYRPTA
jgi:glycosyltransferase involved in cell wall biosynthesis